MNRIQKIRQFLKEAKIELKKVVWPTPKQAFTSTSIVVIFTFLVSMFLGIVDFGLTKILRLFMG